MFIILTFIILLLISKTETKKQLIVWRHNEIEYPLKLSSGFCCEHLLSDRVAGRLG
jgi:hypothetical protein